MFDNVYAPKTEQNSYEPLSQQRAFICTAQSPNGSALSAARAHSDML